MSAARRPFAEGGVPEQPHAWSGLPDERLREEAKPLTACIHVRPSDERLREEAKPPTVIIRA